MGDIDNQLREYNKRIINALVEREASRLRRPIEDRHENEIERLWSRGPDASRELFCDGITESDDDMVDWAIRAYLTGDRDFLGRVVSDMVDNYVKLTLEADE